AGAAYAGHDLVEQVLDARTARIEVHLGARDALLEDRLAGPVERRVVGGTRADRPSRSHAEALLVAAPIGVGVEVARRLVSSGEPGADHDVGRARRQGQGHVTGVAYAAVGPHVLAEIPGGGGTVENSGELRTPDAGHH